MRPATGGCHSGNQHAFCPTLRGAVAVLVFSLACLAGTVTGAIAKHGPLQPTPTCDIAAFASFELPEFVSACAVDVDTEDECTDECSDALTSLVKPRIASCMSLLVHSPITFRGKGVFADTEVQAKRTNGMPDFEATIRLDGRDVTLSRSYLAKNFLQAVVQCNSEAASLNSGACGNARLEVFMSTTVPAMLSACTAPRALVVNPPICNPDCSNAYFNLRSHACFSRYFTTLDTAASNQTMAQILNPRLTRYHTSRYVVKHPDKKAQLTRNAIRNAARLCSPPDKNTYLNISSCSPEGLEAYLKLSVQPFHAECSANVSHPDPNQRFCTATCDAMLQQLLWEPACLGLWSSHEAAKLRAGTGTSGELVTVSRAIQVCAVARESSYSLEAQIRIPDDSPTYSLARGSTSHPAVRAMFFMLCGFLLIVTTVTAWQQRKRCSRSGVRYQRVQRQEV